MTEVPPKPRSRDEGFIAFLRSLAKQPSPPSSDEASPVTVGQQRRNLAALAALRRGLGKEPGTAPEMYPYIVPFLPDSLRSRQEMPYYLVASLFAWHQGDWTGPDAPGLGGSLTRLRREQAAARDMTIEPGDSVERRFVTLLNSIRDDLPNHLRQIVGLLRSAAIPINWLQLLQDIQSWDHPSRRVQRRLAREFWGRDITRPANDAASPPSDPSTAS